MTVIDVIGRFFGTPLSGGTELTEFGLALVIFAALPAVSWRREHVAVDLLDRHTPAAVHRWRQVVIDVLFALCLAALSKRIWELALRSWKREEVSEFLSIELGWIFAYIALMCALTALGLLLRALRGVPAAPASTAANAKTGA